MTCRISPPADLLKDEPLTLAVSNKRPVQAYSNRILRLFKIENATSVKLTALGGAIPTAHRIARFCVAQLEEKAGWRFSSEHVMSTISSTAATLEGDGFGEPPVSPDARRINCVVITITKLS